MTAHESVGVTPFTVTRIFNAPRETVWKAWTERGAGRMVGAERLRHRSRGA